MTKSEHYHRRVRVHWQGFTVPLRDMLSKMSRYAGINWEGEDYDPDDDGRYSVQDVEDTEAFGSHTHTSTDLLGGDTVTRHHMLALDIDVPAILRPSSTPGHHHLLVDLDIPEEDLFEFLDAAVKIGLIEEGYAEVSKSRGETFVRAPWVRKGQPVDPDMTDEEALREEATERLSQGLDLPRVVLGMDPASTGNHTSTPIMWSTGPTSNPARPIF